MNLALYALAAGLEIAGCFAVWTWWRSGASALWLIPGIAALAAFASVLAQSTPAHAGRSFAVYGGLYIAASLVWLRVVEQTSLRLTDVAGAGLVLAGAVVILWGAR